VLDAGCGSGRVTEGLVERLPEGRVIAADAASFVRRVAHRVPESTIEYVRLDILATFGRQPG